MNCFAVELASDNKKIFLEYRVLDTPIAGRWFERFKRTALNKLRPEQPIFQNFDISDDFLKVKIDRINQLVDILNTFVDHPIDGYFDLSKPQESVNRLHVHFPASHSDSIGIERNSYLSEYNDLIHVIESSVFERITGRSRARIMLCHNSRDISKIELDEFKQFTPTRIFGDCFAHYSHVGRHPIELYYADDTNLPNEQIIPQYGITADSMFYFGSDTFATPTDMATFRSNFEAFYRRLGESRWPYAINDPRLAVGYMPVARLVKDFAPDLETRIAYRNLINQSELVGFQF